ncbi:MAG: hypothetical protein HGB23_03345 [Chlorobiaceae bacterium]|nr:hypothetical protein [Chlorobiaceae bacterium]
MSACNRHIFRTNHGSDKPAPENQAVCGGMVAILLSSFNSRIETVHSVVIPQVSAVVL